MSPRVARRCRGGERGSGLSRMALVRVCPSPTAPTTICPLPSLFQDSAAPSMVGSWILAPSGPHQVGDSIAMPCHTFSDITFVDDSLLTTSSLSVEKNPCFFSISRPLLSSTEPSTLPLPNGGEAGDEEEGVNGYQIRFNEEPSPDCNLGYIVPEWVESNPNLFDIQHIYGSSKSLPSTTIILPLKSEKESTVKKQLSSLHPEVLLFLSKVRQLSVREVNDDPKLNTVSQISISSEANYQMRKNLNAESYTLHLAAQEVDENDEEACCYYMWKQKFPVKPESIVKKRLEVEEWVITLAFPYGRRLNRGMKSSGIFSFLPTEMVTGFPFIIQADFLLVSSRESILLDSPWNQGILSCVPSAFINAFVTLVKGADDAPSFSVPNLFNFIPVKSSSIPQLDSVRLSIKEKVTAEHIIPCEPYTSQRIFCKPSEVSRLIPAFWNVLIKAQKFGVDIRSLHSHGRYIVNSYFDNKEYDQVLGFLGVEYVEKEWYGKFIESSNLAKEVPDDIYVVLLHFIAHNWHNCFIDLPLLKSFYASGCVSLLSVRKATNGCQRLCIAQDDNSISWLLKWNQELMSASNLCFMPQSTQKALRVSRGVIEWLQESVNLQLVSFEDYGSKVVKALTDRRLVIAFTHFLYHSLINDYASDWCIRQLCSSLPIVDDYGYVTVQSTQVLMPAKVSKWAGLLGSNPWRTAHYVVLCTEYLSPGAFAGTYTSEGQILPFLQSHVKASDVPYVYPPDAAFATVYSPLTKENAFLLLEWIRNIRSKGTNNLQNFLNCIRTGSWLKTSIGYKPPSESFLPSSEWGNLLQISSVLVDIPLINQEFYGKNIWDYTEELKVIGVRFEFWQASKYIGKHLMDLAACSILTRGNVYSLLKLIRYLREKQLSPENLIQSVKDGRWLQTSHGSKTPSESILLDSKWTIASQVSSLPLIDANFYGEEIVDYKTELDLLGVLVGFNKNYQLVADNFKIPTSSTSSHATIFILECIRHARAPDKLIEKARQTKWLKTHLGYKTPSESFLVASEVCLLNVVNGVPVIDVGFYGSRIRSYEEELKKIGVGVDIGDLSKVIATQLKQLVASSSVTSKNVLALLACYRKMCSTFPTDLLAFTHHEKWLHTRLGFRSPKDSILLDTEWESISSIASLPLIDGNSSFYGHSNEIYNYKNELKDFGVVVDFKSGAEFIIKGIRIPKNPSVITRANVFSLLKCIHNLKGKMEVLPNEFMKSISQRWLKTTMGFKSPGECLLFDPKWGLQREDGPFIDDEFYGSEITSYKNQLKEIGVIVDATVGCLLIADHIKFHSDITAVSRVYMHLSEFKWESQNEAADWIWIPSGSGGGQWVGSSSCILHDKNHMFSSQLYVLDKYYETKLLGFFSTILGVRHGPNIQDYCKVWCSWEASLHHPTVLQCSAFWEFIAKHWNAKTEKLLVGCISKLPVQKNNEIMLSNKQDVFIPDDLLLKDLFGKCSDEAIFIWYPSTSTPSLSRANLNKIYISIGVRTISEAVEKDESFTAEGANVREADPGSLVSKDGLLKIILAFLCDTSLATNSAERHCIVENLCNLQVLELDEPITVSYKLPLATGKNLIVKASKMFHWEKDNGKLFVQSIDGSKRKRGSIKFATFFADVISQGLLSEMPDQIAALSELIRLGCLLDFEEDDVEFLLKIKNLQLFAEDEELLSSISTSSKI
ncbi:hypothetical protein BHE74_00013449 [Ensete ventricosum]|nr:hypothetical protein GW17_00029169 [Ensete ventricosum]RWW78330.1 hypothetical protein BHE74_00013449 [Ensete ventricosum]RZR92730.1 hypothetical protein BHM03_00021084 [Ensete ventricosum]